MVADRVPSWRALVELPLSRDAPAAVRRVVAEALQAEDLQLPLPSTDRQDLVAAISELIELTLDLHPPVHGHLLLTMRVAADNVELRATLPTNVPALLSPTQAPSEDTRALWPLRLRLIHGLTDVVILSLDGQIAVHLRKTRRA